MQLSKRCEYALRILVDLGLADASGRPFISSAELSEHERIPRKFSELILHELRQAGLVRSRRGKTGGYALSTKGRKTPVGAIVRLTHGPLAPIACVSKSAYEKCSCPDEQHCGLRMLMFDVRSAISAVLDRHTVDEVLRITLRKFERDGVPLPFSPES